MQDQTGTQNTASRPPFQGPYELCSQGQLHLTTPVALPEGWTACPEAGLDAALPFPWDPVYVDTYQQAFQPAKLWYNATALAVALDRLGPQTHDAWKTRRLVGLLLDRMRGFVIWDGNRAYLENRFDFRQEGNEIRARWVSGIANAFAILACWEIRQRIPRRELDVLIAGFANAYTRPHVEGRPPPARWISYQDADNRLWFEEYPRACGTPNLVLNGHIFATLALFRAAGVWPGRGYDRLVRAGATTIDDTIHRFRRLGKVNLYSLRGPRKSDYLPIRTIRQQYQLFALTGAPRFLSHARAFTSDMADRLSDDQRRQLRLKEADSLEMRRAIDLMARDSPPWETATGARI